MTQRRIILRVPITFDTDGGKQSHAPMVHATVGGIHTRLILDTGSDTHLLTREIAEATGLRLSDVETGTDHASSTMDSWWIGDVEATLNEASPGARPLVLKDVVAIPAPAAFTAQGIGGGLSPQRLHPSGFVIIDQRADELLVVDGDAEAVRAYLLERDPSAEVLTLERHHVDGLPIIEASIEPFPTVPVLLNTGGRHTEFEPAAVPELAAGDLERIGTGVSGAAVMGGSAGRQVLALGGRRIDVPALWLRSGMGDPPAMIGQDILRGTVLAVGPDASKPVQWQVATPESDPGDGPPR